MILKKVYISNFGKLQDFTYIFDDGINTIYAQNGFGKTTLATFIKVMLYGFSNKSARDLSKNERKKYLPWQGGKYGGFIEFEVDGQEYKLEKFFGKTEKEDVINLYDLKTNKQLPMKQEMGEKIFKIDADGFVKSIYFPETDTENFENLSIQARLSNRIENTSDLNDYDKALKVLEEKRKFYLKSNGNGKITDIRNELNQINREIEECKKSRELVQNYEENLKTLNNEVLRLEEEKRRLDAYIQSNQRQLEFLAKAEHLKSLENDTVRIKEKLQEYSAFFAKHLPTQNEIVQMEVLEREVRELKDKFNQILPNENDYLFYKNTNAVFSNLSAKNIDNAIDLTLNKEKAKTSKFRFLYLLFSLVSLFIGIGLLQTSIYISVVAFVLTVVLLVLFVIGLKKGENITNSGIVLNEVQKLLPNINFNERTLLNDLFEIKNQYEKWNSIRNYLSQTDVEIQRYETELNEKQDRLNFFLCNYLRSENDYATIQIIKSNFMTYNYLLEQVREKEGAMKNFAVSNNMVTNTNSVQGQDSFNADAEFKRLNLALDNAKGQMLNLKQKLIVEQDSLAKLSEFERRRDNLILQLEESTKQHSLILKTIELLTQAKESLNSRFLSPMQTNFNEVMNKLNTAIINNGVLDTDLNLSINCGGELKSTDYFSQGYKKILDFATRVSLLKSIFAQEKPFIILDDPFISLDEVNLEKINYLLKELSNDYQIIYFVCRNDRGVA
ncbi:MAG: AAA family ATPase [Clostridia bacterium]|nr:AAA family ATPase [Clostridia bacterium]